jgi:hypothetical protein
MEVRMRAQLYVYSLLCIATLASGCSEPRVYVGDGSLYQVAMTADTMAALANDNGGIFIVETRALLPIKNPTNTEMAELRSGVSRYKGLPFTRLPWIAREDLALQLDFTLSNLDTKAHDVDVIVNGINEFHEYVPGVIEVEDEAPVALHSQWERRYRVPAKERLAVTVREEEFDEVAVDLATVVNGAPNSDEVVYFENKSSTDPRSMKYIPAVIPGLAGLRLGLRSSAAEPMLLEASIRVRDVGGKLADKGEPTMQIMPMEFRSVAPEN